MRRWQEICSKLSLTLDLHRVIQSLGLERPLRSSSPSISPALPSPPIDCVPKQHSSVSFKPLQGWLPHLCPGHLFQCLNTLSVKEFFPVSNLNLPWNNLSHFLMPCYLGAETKPHLATTYFQAVVGSNKVPLSLIFSRLKSPIILAILKHGRSIKAKKSDPHL